MAIITPTITTADAHEYREQLERIATYAEGVHIDFADGELAPSVLLPIDQAWRSDDLITHAHVMVHDPLSVLEDIEHLEADLVILHAESEHLQETLEALSENGTRTGVALLPETSVAELEELDIGSYIEHVLLFGGHLGYQGGTADLTQLQKIVKLRELFGDVEIGWDGGVTHENIAEIARAGVDVINVGSYLKKAEDPKKAYATLLNLIS